MEYESVSEELGIELVGYSIVMRENLSRTLIRRSLATSIGCISSHSE